MSIEISHENKGTETNLELWLHVFSEMVGRRFLLSALRISDTHRSYNVPGQGSSVHFLHKMNDKNQYIHRGKTDRFRQGYVQNNMVKIDDISAGIQGCTQQTYEEKQGCHTF